MADPVKFNFSSYPVAIPAIPAIREQELQPESRESQESQRLNGANAGSLLNEVPPLNRRIAGIAEVKDDFQDDRHFCRECRHQSNAGFCIQQRFRPVDDMPRRCKDFNGYPDRTDRSAIGTAAPAPDPLQVTVFTPSGTPKPEPTPSARMVSEAEHNAAGRHFKFLATWPDGSQCYLCQMPRQTIDEMRAQYPTTTHIEPVLNEEYPDED